MRAQRVPIGVQVYTHLLVKEGASVRMGGPEEGTRLAISLASPSPICSNNRWP